MNERLIHLREGASLGNEPLEVQMGIADPSLGTWLWRRNQHVQHIPFTIECPYCRERMSIQTGITGTLTQARVVTRRGKDITGEIVPPTLLVLRCSPCRQTFTIPQGVEKPV